MKKLCLLVMGFFFLTAPMLASPSGFSLKVGGGMSYFSVGELNSVLTDWDRYIRVINQNIGGEMKAFHFGADFAVEAVYHLSPKIGVGLAVGYGWAQKKGSTHREYPGYEGQVRVDDTWTPKIRVIPITLSGYYTMPLNPKWSAVLGAGFGYYHVLFDFKNSTQEYRPAGDSSFVSDFRAGRGTLGLQGSAAVEMSLSPFISLYASCCFRLAYVSGFIGTREMTWNDKSGSGVETDEDQTFWIYTYNYHDAGYINISFNETEPVSGGSSTRSGVHKGKIDISGATLGLGARIKF